MKHRRYPFYPMFPHWKHLDRSYFIGWKPRSHTGPLGIFSRLPWTSFHLRPGHFFASRQLQDQQWTLRLGSLAGSLRIADGLVMCWCFSGGWSIWSHQSDEHLPLYRDFICLERSRLYCCFTSLTWSQWPKGTGLSSLRWSSLLGIPRVKRPGQSVWPGATWIVLLSPSLRFSLLQHVVKTSMWLQFLFPVPMKTPPWNPWHFVQVASRPDSHPIPKLRQRNPVAEWPVQWMSTAFPYLAVFWKWLTVTLPNSQFESKEYPIFRQGNSLG